MIKDKDEIIAFLMKRRKRAMEKVEITKNYNHEDHTFHWGWEKWYNQGVLSNIQNILDEIDINILDWKEKTWK